MKQFILSIGIMCLITQSSSAMNFTQEQQDFMHQNPALVAAMNYANTFRNLSQEEQPGALECMKKNLDDLIKHATYNRIFYRALPNGGHEEPFYDTIVNMATWFNGNDQYKNEYKKITDTIHQIMAQRDTRTYSTSTTREIPVADSVENNSNNQDHVAPHENQTEQTNTTQQQGESSMPVIKQEESYRKLVGTALQFFGLGLITFGVSLVIVGIIYKIKNKSAKSKKIGIENSILETQKS